MNGVDFYKKSESKASSSKGNKAITEQKYESSKIIKNSGKLFSNDRYEDENDKKDTSWDNDKNKADRIDTGVKERRYSLSLDGADFSNNPKSNELSDENNKAIAKRKYEFSKIIKNSRKLSSNDRYEDEGDEDGTSLDNDENEEDEIDISAKKKVTAKQKRKSQNYLNSQITKNTKKLFQDRPDEDEDDDIETDENEYENDDSTTDNDEDEYRDRGNKSKNRRSGARTKNKKGIEAEEELPNLRKAYEKFDDYRQNLREDEGLTCAKIFKSLKPLTEEGKGDFPVKPQSGKKKNGKFSSESEEYYSLLRDKRFQSEISAVIELAKNGKSRENDRQAFSNNERKQSKMVKETTRELLEKYESLRESMSKKYPIIVRNRLLLTEDL